MENSFDVVVIGGGPGGYVAAIRCAQLGKKTALIEKQDLGGTCLNQGCIPTKSLLMSAEVYHTVVNAAKFGIFVKDVDFDFLGIMKRKDIVVETLRNGVKALLKAAGVTVIQGKGKLKDINTVALSDGMEIHAQNIIIATGLTPATLPVPGTDLPDVLSSEGVLSLKECPDSIIVIGGGVIGMEFATVFNALGKKVTVIEMLEHILPTTDEEIAGLLERSLNKKGVEFHTGAKLKEIRKAGRLECIFEKNGSESSVVGDICIMAVGRKPQSEGLGLETVGISLQRGFIPVDEYMRANGSNIYAIGDITGKIQLAHAASAEALVAAHNIAGQKSRMEYDIVPSCIYTTPEIASVGLTERQAVGKGMNIKVGSFNTASNGKSMIMGEREGIVKIITDKETGTILGVHIMAPRASDMIAEICTAMKSEATIEELAQSIHPHPTVSEMIMEAAHDVENLCVHKLRK